MRTLTITARSKNIPLEKAWDLVTDIEKYPQRVKYVKKVKSYGTGIGSQWDDVTTILWIPLRMRHTVKSIEKNKEYSFVIPLHFGGYMEQKYTLSWEDDKSITRALIKYDLGNKFLNATIGSILKKRLKNMLISSFQKTGGEVYAENEI